MNDLKTDSETETEKIFKTEILRNGKEPATHKTVTETKLIFETEISLAPRLQT